MAGSRVERAEQEMKPRSNRRLIAPLLTATLLLTMGGSLLLTRPSAGTPEPTKSELEAFVRMAPNAFAPMIAAKESAIPIEVRPLPVGVGLPNGSSLRVTHPGIRTSYESGTWFGDFSFGEFRPPIVEEGRVVSRLGFRGTDWRRALYVVVEGTDGPRGGEDLAPDSAIGFGRAVRRDDGPLPMESGRYVVHAPGTSADGFTIEASGPAAPRRVILAPAELPPETTAEAENYAVLYDEFALVRRRLANSDEADQRPNTLFTALLTSVFHRETPMLAYGEQFDVTGFAHIYRRAGTRWRYSRSWRLEGGARTTFATDEAQYRLQRKNHGLSPVTLGTPKIFVAQSAESFDP